MIRRATTADHASIRVVVAAAFGSDAEADLVERIRVSPEYEPSMDLVAERDDLGVVGHVMISRALLRSADSSERSIVMLSPLAVAPAAQGAGVGGELVRVATAIADRHGEPLLVLEGNPAYYHRFGFVAAADHGITLPLPEWAPTAAAQVMLLSSFDPTDATVRGMVSYPSAFDGLD
ncbi:MAG TPA: N-acetyltransferase [Ilumatobacteraceae bacterium]|nr:N-acetyltransferase [Ilumatobacteraceae bacterium]